MAKFRVVFTARFEGHVDAEDAEQAAHEVHIPEANSTTYVTGSFEVLEIAEEQADGES
jgi:hypothetical protein